MRSSAREHRLPNRRILAHALAWVAVALLGITLAGCVEIDTVVSPDCRIRRVIKCRVDKRHRDAAKSELQQVFHRGKGWYIKEWDQGEQVEFCATCRSSKPADDPFGQLVSIKRESVGAKQHYIYDETLTDGSVVNPGDRVYVAGAQVLYTVVMPGRVDESLVSAPGAEVASVDAGAVVLKLTMGDLSSEGGVKIHIESYRVNRVWVGLGIILGLIGLLVLYWLFVRLSVWRRARAERLAEIEAATDKDLLELGLAPAPSEPDDDGEDAPAETMDGAPEPSDFEIVDVIEDDEDEKPEEK